jgi:hypothetical protein
MFPKSPFSGNGFETDASTVRNTANAATDIHAEFIDCFHLFLYDEKV